MYKSVNASSVYSEDGDFKKYTATAQGNNNGHCVEYRVILTGDDCTEEKMNEALDKSFSEIEEFMQKEIEAKSYQQIN
jgi:hypothetical protein